MLRSCKYSHSLFFPFCQMGLLLFFAAFFYTGSSINGLDLWRVTKRLTHELSLRKMIDKAVCCDMGPSNQSMWRAAGIKSKRQDSCCTVPTKKMFTMQLHLFNILFKEMKWLRCAL